MLLLVTRCACSLIGSRLVHGAWWQPSATATDLSDPFVSISNMATKEDLVRNIRGWMRAEEEMKVLQKELKERRAKRKGFADELVSIMKDNEIDGFDMQEGRLIYTRNRVKAPISKKHLLACLAQYAAAHPAADLDPAEMGQFILDSRKVQTKEGVRHRPAGKSVDPE